MKWTLAGTLERPPHISAELATTLHLKYNYVTIYNRQYFILQDTIMQIVA